MQHTQNNNEPSNKMQLGATRDVQDQPLVGIWQDDGFVAGRVRQVELGLDVRLRRDGLVHTCDVS